MSPEELKKWLDAYKQFNGIPIDDESNDVVIQLYLEAGIEEAKRRACDIKEWEFDKLPAQIKLGIFKYINLSEAREADYGIASESIGGMSQTFTKFTNANDYYKEAYDYFDKYCSRTNDMTLAFISAKRGVCCRGSYRSYNS